jgi:hypothetical protein
MELFITVNSATIATTTTTTTTINNDYEYNQRDATI